jgi:hypothetical protein
VTRKRKKMNGITDYFSSSQSNNELEQMCGGLQLTRMQRFYAFGGCFALGTIVSLCSTLLFIQGNAPGFAVMYTVGNLIALIGTGFLIGFLTQFKVI